MTEIVFDEMTRILLESVKKRRRAHRISPVSQCKQIARNGAISYKVKNITENKIGEIYRFGTDQNIGPIKTGSFSHSRLCYLTKMHNAWELMYEKLHDDIYYEYLYEPFRQRIDNAKADTLKVIELLAKGEPMRIWMGNMPHALCGLAYLCYAARSSDSKFYIAYCPNDKRFDKYGNTSWANLNRDQKDIKSIMDKGYKSYTELLGNLTNFLPEYIHHDWIYYRIFVLEKGIDDIPHMPYNIMEAHKLCSDNRKALSEAAKCGCFYCKRIFDPKEIYEYLPNSNDAFCPHCGIDSVIPENDKYPLTPEFLKLMNEYWFGYDHIEDQLTANARAVQFMQKRE